MGLEIGAEDVFSALVKCRRYILHVILAVISMNTCSYIRCLVHGNRTKFL